MREREKGRQDALSCPCLWILNASSVSLVVCLFGQSPPLSPSLNSCRMQAHLSPSDPRRHSCAGSCPWAGGLGGDSPRPAGSCFKSSREVWGHCFWCPPPHSLSHITNFIHQNDLPYEPCFSKTFTSKDTKRETQSKA